MRSQRWRRGNQKEGKRDRRGCAVTQNELMIFLVRYTTDCQEGCAGYVESITIKAGYKRYFLLTLTDKQSVISVG